MLFRKTSVCGLAEEMKTFILFTEQSHESHIIPLNEANFRRQAEQKRTNIDSKRICFLEHADTMFQALGLLSLLNTAKVIWL